MLTAAKACHCEHSLSSVMSVEAWQAVYLLLYLAPSFCFLTFETTEPSLWIFASRATVCIQLAHLPHTLPKPSSSSIVTLPTRPIFNIPGTFDTTNAAASITTTIHSKKHAVESVREHNEPVKHQEARHTENMDKLKARIAWLERQVQQEPIDSAAISEAQAQKEAAEDETQQARTRKSEAVKNEEKIRTVLDSANTSLSAHSIKIDVLEKEKTALESTRLALERKLSDLQGMFDKERTEHLDNHAKLTELFHAAGQH